MKQVFAMSLINLPQITSSTLLFVILKLTIIITKTIRGNQHLRIFTDNSNLKIYNIGIKGLLMRG